VCLQNLPVVFCLDRAGFAGADGPTHHGAYDLAYMRCIPNMVIAAPMNEEELRNLMFTAQKTNQSPFTIRYPRGEGVMADWRLPFQEITIGKGRKLKEGKDIAIVSIGHIGNLALKAAQNLENEGLSIAFYDARFVKPLDAEMFHEIFTRFDKVITVEDGCLMGGFGSAVLEFAADHGYAARIKRLGIPDLVIEHGEQPELFKECGFDTNGIMQAALELAEPVKLV
ncbi:MAG TPA: transketolase C-terminal domain-containing protein, partial [Catalimonadaceae bacterium]|nr:transketolase C-terminal domain-containing protein [Catalimonadaceae bacterium]